MAIQALDSDGALSQSAKYFSLPPANTEVDVLAAAFQGDRLGILWHGTRLPDASEGPDAFDALVTEFVVTDLSGSITTPSPPMRLNYLTTQTLYPDIAYNLFLYPLGGSVWATIAYTGTGPEWRGYRADPGIDPEPLPLANSLPFGPRSVAGRSPIHAIPQAAAVVGTTLFVTGYDCEWSGGSSCDPGLVFAGYDVETWTPLSENFVRLSTTGYPMSDGLQRPPAIGKLDDGLAALWTQYSSSGTLLLGRAVFDAKGVIRTARTVEPSDLIPKAVVEAPSGGALLIATRVTAAGDTLEHTLVAQPLDARLNFVGQAYAIGPTSNDEPAAVALSSNPDGRFLLSFRQPHAQHRILHADFCR